MANEKILLKAQAGKLGIDGYRTMSLDELKAAIASAQGTSKGKGKSSATSSTNGSTPAKGKGKSATPAKGKGKTATPAKGKGKSTVSKSAPAKSKSQKTTPAKGKASAAKGTAKRPTAAAGKGKGSTTAKAAKSTTAKARRGKAVQGRADIDRKAINWRAESGVGKTGKRADVMAALRKRNGDYDKVFADLQGNALRYYPNALNSFPTAPSRKHAAERMLRWLINRVALDFVMATEQHTPGERAGYGQSDKPSDIRRRERREELRAARAKADRKAARDAKSGRTPAKAKGGKGKATAKGKGRK